MKKRVIFNLLLVILIFFLFYVLYQSIREPIKFKAEKEKRELAVINKLIEIRKAQELFRGVKGGFAPTWDSLKKVLRHDSFMIVQVFGDPDDPTKQDEVYYDTIYKSAYDSVLKLGINLDSLEFVPFGKGATFDIKADTLTYQSTLVNVVEVGVKRKVFMGPWGDPRFKRYDDRYDPESVIKFGDLNRPTLAGNWER